MSIDKRDGCGKTEEAEDRANQGSNLDQLTTGTEKEVQKTGNEHATLVGDDRELRIEGRIAVEAF